MMMFVLFQASMSVVMVILLYVVTTYSLSHQTNADSTDIQTENSQREDSLDRGTANSAPIVRNNLLEGLDKKEKVRSDSHLEQQRYDLVTQN